MVRLVNEPDPRDDGAPSHDRRLLTPEDPMIGRLAGSRDPFEGRGARRRQLRLRIEGILALGMAIVACGLTAGLWIHTLAPLIGLFGRG